MSIFAAMTAAVFLLLLAFGGRDRWIALIVWAPWLIAAPWAFAVPPPVGWTVACRVHRVIDGDTVEVKVERILTVRLKDCWAPEKTGATKLKGLESRDNLDTMIGKDDYDDMEDGRVPSQILHIDGNEKLADVFTFGRVVGTLWGNTDSEKSFNQMQVESGHATKTKGGP